LPLRHILAEGSRGHKGRDRLGRGSDGALATPDGLESPRPLGQNESGVRCMSRRWRLKDLMRLIAIMAIYLAALHSLREGPSDDLVTIWGQMISAFLLFCVLPLHIARAWARSL
jgi:hypothetical protein